MIMCIIDDEIFLLTVTLDVYAVLADLLMLALLLYIRLIEDD